jgi:hypothetical protein
VNSVAGSTCATFAHHWTTRTSAIEPANSAATTSAVRQRMPSSRASAAQTGTAATCSGRPTIRAASQPASPVDMINTSSTRWPGTKLPNIGVRSSSIPKPRSRAWAKFSQSSAKK